jgi:hypothetical protein
MSPVVVVQALPTNLTEAKSSDCDRDRVESGLRRGGATALVGRKRATARVKNVGAVLPRVGLTAHGMTEMFMRTFNRSAVVTTRKQSRHADIWNTGVILDDVRNAIPIEKLS